MLQIESARDQTGSSGETKASAQDSGSGGLTDDGREDRRERGEEVVGAGCPGGGRGGCGEERHERGEPSPPCRERHRGWSDGRALRSPRTRGGAAVALVVVVTFP